VNADNVDIGAGVSPRRSAVIWLGRALGPMVALGLYLVLGAVAEGLAPEGRATAAIGALIAIFWMTEALPLAATSLLPIILFPLAGVYSVQEAATPYANKLIFLFMGGFMIALAIERWKLHRRIALHIVALAGTRPARLVAGFMAATALLSMWISNTATTIMMFPIGLSVIQLLEQHGPHGRRPPEAPPSGTGVCLMLGIAYAASIGGVATIIGTPPNLFMAGFLHESYGIRIGFAQWMLLGLPMATLFLALTWLVLTRFVFALPRDEMPGARELLATAVRDLGRISRGERLVMAVATLTASAWILREPLANWEWLAARVPAVAAVDDTIIALAGALLLFVLPVDARRGVFVLDWPTARKLPWEVLILFGGGLSLAAAITASGLDLWIGTLLAGLERMPLFLLMVAVTACVIFLTEITSNIATVATFLPIIAGLAMGIDPAWLLALIASAAIAASCAFMLPVATAPNAIVFASGHLTIGQMMRAGFWLNLLGILVIPLIVYFLGLHVLGAPISP
jgi:solute carrier family 13 (sodium-dependent dicarboxylate transporter), member 2/3/5